MGEEQNGIPSRVKVLENEVGHINDRLDELKQDNTVEHKEITRSVGKLNGIGIGILAALVVSLAERLLR